MASTGSVDGWPLGPGPNGIGRGWVESIAPAADHNTRFSDNIKEYCVAIQASQNRTMHTPVTAVMCTDQHFQSH